MNTSPAPEPGPRHSLRGLLARLWTASSSDKQRKLDEEQFARTLDSIQPQLEQDSVLPGIEVKYIDL